MPLVPTEFGVKLLVGLSTGLFLLLVVSTILVRLFWSLLARNTERPRPTFGKSLLVATSGGFLFLPFFLLLDSFASKPYAGTVGVIVSFFVSAVLIHAYFMIRKTDGRRLSRSFALSGLLLTLLLSGYALATTLREGSRLVLQRNAAFSDARLLRKSKTNLKNIGIAAHEFSEHPPEFASVTEEFKSRFGSEIFPPGGTALEDGRPGHGWTTQLLPYLGESVLYERIDRSKPWNDPANVAVYREETPSVFRSSTKSRDREFYRNDEGFGLTDYAANQRVMPYGRPMAFKQITSGLYNTLLCGEVNTDLKPWGHPFNGRDPGLGLNRTPLGFGSGRHRSDSVVFISADGSARAISVDIDDRVLKELADPKGNNYYMDDIHDF